MKQKILSLITLLVLCTGVISAQSNKAHDKGTVCPEAQVENARCKGDSVHCKHMKTHRHGHHSLVGKAAQNGQQFGKGQGDKQMRKEQMRKRRAKGMRRNFQRVKSTPKCKCATCVELRKQEEIQAKIDSMRKETFKLQHKLDSLRGFTPHKGNMPPVENK